MSVTEDESTEGVYEYALGSELGECCCHILDELLGGAQNVDWHRNGKSR